MAKQQQQDLQRTTQYIDSMLSMEQQASKKDASQKTSPIEKGKGTPSLKDSLKARFSEPPAPPPQAPLPEKPDVAAQRSLASVTTTFSPSSLARSDTEKPKHGFSSPIKTALIAATEPLPSAADIQNLVDALSKAKQEVEVQNVRLREVEDALVQERVKREDAEERAKRLEKEKESALPDIGKLAPPPSPAKSEESTTPIEDVRQDDSELEESEKVHNKNLQERLDKLLAEYTEVKLLAEQWRHEKESAEKERDEERKERKSLAELVEQFRAQETERAEKEKKREAKRGRRRSRSASADGTVTREVDGNEENDAKDHVEDGDKTFVSGSKEVESNGHPVIHQKHPQGSDQSDTQALMRRGAHMEYTAPMIAALSVVAIGYLIMTLGNKMQPSDRVKP
jgi:hypothetical protein